MRPLSPNHLLLLAGLLVLAVNAVILGKAWYNRSAAPESVLQLSERELQLRRSMDESNGLQLKLVWRSPSDDGFDDIYHWRELSASQLAAVGILPQPPVPGRCCRETRQPVLAVLELDGPLYRQQLQRVRQLLADARMRLRRQPADRERRDQVKDLESQLQTIEQGSRLYLAAVGRDLQALRQQFPDTRHYAIVGALLEAGHDREGQPQGRIIELLVRELHVPRHWREQLQHSNGHNGRAKFRASVAWGRNLEPWLQDVSVDQSIDTAVTGH